LLHDKTRVSTIKIYKTAKEAVGEEKSVQFITNGYIVFGIILAPIAIYDLLTDIILFSFFDVEKAKKNQNERLNNGQ
jgi:hypothetical protein